MIVSFVYKTNVRIAIVSIKNEMVLLYIIVKITKRPS